MRRLPVLLVLAALCALPAQAFAAPTVVQFQPGPGPTTPRSVAAGPDGNVWFTDDKDPEAIGRITPGGAYDLFRTDVSHDGQQGEITAGPGGLWFTEANRDIIGRVSTSGVVREFPVSQGHPTGITAGPDGNLWFTAPAGDGAIARMTPSGAVTFIPVLTKGGSPASIAAGPDGNLWFTETGSRRIGRMTTQGDVAEFSTGIGGTPRQITAGPDGNLWFTETGVNPAIARITPSGTVTEF